MEPEFVRPDICMGTYRAGITVYICVYINVIADVDGR
jgi:hypothetical protein